MRSGIYKWTSPSNQSYIGQAINLTRRYNFFKNNPETIDYTSHNSAIDRARRKYPEFNQWNYEVLKVVDTENKSKEEISKLLDEREIYYIQKFDTYKHGYNSTKGGAGTCGKTGRTNKQKAGLRKRRSYAGENNPNFGKSHSQETKEIIRKTNLGRKQSVSTRLKKAIPINQYDLDGNFIKTWSLGATEVMKKLSIDKSSIGRCCKGKKHTAGGFRWSYLS